MKKFRVLALVLSLVMVVALFAGCDKKPKPIDKDPFYGAKLAVYSIDCTDLGYSLKVENGTWAETYDAVVALYKAETDPVKRYKLMHKAEDLLMSTGCITPIYFYTDLYMIDPALKGFFSSPLGYKFFMYSNLNGKTDNVEVCLASEPDTIDPALNSAVDGATILVHCFSGLIKWAQDASGKLVLVPDACKAIPEGKVNADGTVTYVFELKDGMKWSDGSDVTAADFEYAWKRAAADATAADYGYMFDIIKGYPNDLAVSADGNNLTVTINNACAYFLELCAFPTYMPVKKSVVDGNEAWATSPATYVCNGPYIIKSWEHNQKIVLAKNPNYFDAANITMEQITMNLSDNDTAMLANFKNGDWQFIDSVPNDEIDALKRDYADSFVITGQMGTYYVIFNNNKDLLPKALSDTMTNEAVANANKEIRYALSLIIDRNHVVEEIGKAGQNPASSFVSSGLTDTDGKEFFENAGSNPGFVGYFNTAKSAYAANCDEAVEILKKYYTYDGDKFTDFPSFDYLYNTGSGHQAIGEYLQAAWEAYGISCQLVNQEWATFLNTRKDGNFTVARNGWLADYNDPSSYLDMWTTASGNNDAQFGK